jgi:hypothetical protein
VRRRRDEDLVSDRRELDQRFRRRDRHGEHDPRRAVCARHEDRCTRGAPRGQPVVDDHDRPAAEPEQGTVAPEANRAATKLFALGAPVREGQPDLV